jgi:hypothetical protein
MRDILKKAHLLREGSDMKFVFIAKHRTIWPVAWLGGALGVSRSGFQSAGYGWVTGCHPSEGSREACWHFPLPANGRSSVAPGGDCVCHAYRRPVVRPH